MKLPKVGSKFRWMTRVHHVLGIIEDSGHQLIVTKYWRGRSWGFEVIDELDYPHFREPLRSPKPLSKV